MITDEHDMVDLLAVPIGRSRGQAVGRPRVFGSSDGLLLSVTRDADGPRIRVSIGESVIWGDHGPLAGHAPAGVRFDDLAFLEFFAEHWAALWLEGAPANANGQGGTPGQRRPSRGAEERRHRERAMSFRERHCVSRTMVNAGDRGTQPDWWLIGSGDRMGVSVPEMGLRHSLPLGQTMGALERCCNAIAEHAAAHVSERAGRLVAQWTTRRDRAGRLDNVRLYTGLGDAGLIEQVANDVGGDTIAEVVNHRSPILAVARMRPTEVGSADLRLLFDAISTSCKRETPALDTLTRESVRITETAQFDRLPPYAQGQEVAAWLRRSLGWADDLPLDPMDFLTRHGVEVCRVVLETSAIDAVAFWGGRNGPGVIVNPNGRFAGSSYGFRATLAHEICHLLIDRESRLPLADVVGGVVPESLEKRARAFAAELLLPQRVAYDAFLALGGTLPAAKTVVGRLIRQYDVSRWIVSHQLGNAIDLFSEDDPRSIGPILSFLKTLTSFTGVQHRRAGPLP